jgi:nucleoside-diphosphate-sugar epimerase
MPRRVVLITGATGTLGTLATAALLQDSDVEIVAPVRARHPKDAVAAAVTRVFALAGYKPETNWQQRLHQILLPAGVDQPEAPDPLADLDALASKLGVNEIVHCAGCLSYFDEQKLQAVNVEMTRRFVTAAERWNVERFVHISTAFASGFADGPIHEQLHRQATTDPTFYTTSKRLGEQIVADSDIPYLIVRPSIVIGDSRDGHYTGPRYGLYQLWSGVERFLLNEWSPELHYVAPEQSVPLIHQDAFQSGFMAAWRGLPDNSVCHLTSRTSPNVREIAELFVQKYLRPRSVHYYDRLADVPLDAIPEPQRAFLAMAAVNIEISSRKWDFDTDNLDRLVADGAAFTDASIASVERCQDAYLSRSRRIARFSAKFSERFPEATLVA